MATKHRIVIDLLNVTDAQATRIANQVWAALGDLPCDSFIYPTWDAPGWDPVDGVVRVSLPELEE